jgi:hypothetical protein
MSENPIFAAPPVAEGEETSRYDEMIELAFAEENPANVSEHADNEIFGGMEETMRANDVAMPEDHYHESMTWIADFAKQVAGVESREDMAGWLINIITHMRNTGRKAGDPSDIIRYVQEAASVRESRGF